MTLTIGQLAASGLRWQRMNRGLLFHYVQDDGSTACGYRRLGGLMGIAERELQAPENQACVACVAKLEARHG